MLGRNLLIDFHGGMQGARKRWILDDRKTSLIFTAMASTPCNNAHGRVHTSLVFKATA